MQALPDREAGLLYIPITVCFRCGARSEAQANFTSNGPNRLLQEDQLQLGSEELPEFKRVYHRKIQELQERVDAVRTEVKEKKARYS